MQRTVADALSEALLESFPPRRPYPPSDFRRPPMPGPVAHYLERVIAWNLEDVRSQLRHLSAEWFDDKDDEVLRARNAFAETVAEHAHVPQHVWRKQLQEAVRRTLHYLVEPAPALADFSFQGISAEMPVSLILKRVAFFSPYDYLKDAADVYFQNKSLRKIDRERFLAMLRQVDRRMAHEYSADDWVELLEPLFKYMQPAPNTDGSAVPVALLEDFFDEKEAEPVVQRLRRYQDEVHGEPAVTARELRELLATSNGNVEPPERPSRPAKSPPSGSSSRPSSEAESVPLWKRYQSNPQNKPRQHSHTEARESPSGDASQPSSEVAEASPRWKQFRAKTSAGPQGTLEALEQDVLGARGKRNRRLFVKHLFGGSKEDYQTALQHIATSGAWPEASRIIAQEVFKKHRVNIYSEEAVSFTDAVEGQYRGS